MIVPFEGLIDAPFCWGNSAPEAFIGENTSPEAERLWIRTAHRGLGSC